MKNSANSNIFSRQIQHCLDRYAAHVTGTPDDLICCMSTRPLSEMAKAAIESSMDKLGFGRGRTSWIVLEGNGENASLTTQTTGSIPPTTNLNAQTIGPIPSTANLTADDTFALLETIDPNALIAADEAAVNMLESTYKCTLMRDESNRILGRTVAAFANFETLLETAESKQLAWRVLKTLALD